MKNRYKILAISLTIGVVMGVSALSFAQPPDPPGGGHGMTGDQAPGGGAPVGSGLVVLLGMGAAYGAKKIFQVNKKLEE